MDDRRRQRLTTFFHGPRFRGDRSRLIEASGLTKGRIAQFFDSTQPFGERAARNLAERLNLAPDFFETDHGGMTIAAEDGRAYNVSPIGPFENEVPMISWVKAGNWDSAYDPYQPGDASEWLPCPVRHGPRTIALRVSGDSMFNPAGRPSYSDGDVIFVDPDREPSPGDRVVVRLADTNKATFKQLVVEDGRRLLKALNPDWKPRYIELAEDAVMVGLVIGTWRPET